MNHTLTAKMHCSERIRERLNRHGGNMKKLIENMKNHTDLNPWYWRSVGEKDYAFDVVEAYPLKEHDATPQPGSKLYIDEDENGNIIWVGENGTQMLIESYIAESESQNGDTICSFIAGCHAHFLQNEFGRTTQCRK